MKSCDPVLTGATWVTRCVRAPSGISPSGDRAQEWGPFSRRKDVTLAGFEERYSSCYRLGSGTGGDRTEREGDRDRDRDNDCLLDI